MTTLTELIDALNAGKTTATEAVQYCLTETAKDYNQGLFVCVNADAAKKSAAEIDAARATGIPIGRLAGVPIAIADNIAVGGELMQCGSKILEQFRPTYTATIVERLVAEGAIIIGRTTLDEFGQFRPGMGAISSVTHGCVWATISSDPIATLFDDDCSVEKYNQCVIFEGTTGRISRFGVSTIFPAISRPGIIAKSAADVTLLLNILAGEDNKDAISLPWDADTFSTATLQKSKKVGVVSELLKQLTDTKQKAEFDTFLKSMQSQGMAVTEISMPHLQYATQVFEVIAACEASSSLAKFDGAHENIRVADADYAALRKKYGEHDWNAVGTLDQMYLFSRSEGLNYDSRLTVTLGALFLNGEHFENTYLKAAKIRRLIQNDYVDAFKNVDLLVAPMLCGNDNNAANLVAAIRLAGIPAAAFGKQNVILMAAQESEKMLID